MNFDLSASVGRIRYLASLRHARKYLEIGVRDGATFFAVPLPLKVGVDPAFTFDPTEQEVSGTRFFPLPSSLFFHKLKKRQVEVWGPEKEGETMEDRPRFDIIFIDGLHTFEQSYKDFTDSLEFAHENTLWLFDDTVTCDKYSAIPNEEESLRLRKEAGCPGSPWHGDVYKTVMAIHDFHQEYSYCTLMGGNPQTVVWKAERSARNPLFGSLQTIARMRYCDLLTYHVVLMPVEDDQLPRLVGKCLSPADLVNPFDNALTALMTKDHQNW